MTSNHPSKQKRRSKAEMQALVSKYEHTPGISLKAFCAQHQIFENSFYNTRKRYSVIKQPKTSGFIPLDMPPALPASSAILFAEVGTIKLYQAVTAEYLKSLVV